MARRRWPATFLTWTVGPGTSGPPSFNLRKRQDQTAQRSRNLVSRLSSMFGKPIYSQYRRITRVARIISVDLFISSWDTKIACLARTKSSAWHGLRPLRVPVQ